MKSLHYKKRFMLTVNDLIPRIGSVMEASREVARSRRLRKLLELVLALGKSKLLLKNLAANWVSFLFPRQATT